MIDRAHIDVLIELAGAGGSTTDPAEIAPHLHEWRDKFNGRTPLMLMPSDTETLSRLVSYCHKHRIAIVPQGGNTGLVGGGIPGLEGRDEVLVSLKRMTRILDVDAQDFSITAEAGAPVATLQAAAADADRLFPLSLASEGSCTVGGVISTNAGGVHVLRYGTTRALLMGLEAVLPTGAVVNSLSSLRKDNTGYNLAQLLAGAEGTLGIVTKATFRLYPPERQKHTCWLAVESPAAALSLLASLREATGDRVSAFELMPRVGLEMVFRHIPNTRDPLTAPYPWYVLTDVATSREDPGLAAALDAWLEARLEDGAILDGAIAGTVAQAQDFWRVRESMSEAQKHEGGSIKHDVSVPVSRVPAFLTRATEAIEQTYPGARVTPFGHLGDGNIHFNVMQPKDGDKQAFLNEWEGMNRLVHDIVTDMKGSISAEHGIGTLKRGELARLKGQHDLDAMRAIKAALDPHNIMNPGALFG
ncbi:FAD-binding oxidoreductase [Kordiimonas marina]|uniref:FAD-binding oxidoreductase n=1 Tax=Kordiimonas marina TaxID=2872312 RepID=UPI001FF23309|nr:FAD-binding oxidoreductase [Kordiimonas marina]MCJ9429117.1 FAD-binding oxidoreductase [Kordiimonas marina]